MKCLGHFSVAARAAPLLFSLILLAMLCLQVPARAGDEDTKMEKKAAEEKSPEDTAVPKEAESPEMSVGNNEEPTPDYQEINPVKTVSARALKERDPDENVDYSKLTDQVEGAEAMHGVLPPALGFRGYRPNMVAVGAGDRTPGFGAFVEYSWNRVGLGVFASNLNNHGQDRLAASYGFAGIYGLYRWLPFDISPYFLLGLEAGSQTDEALGGLTGLGVEARIYSGWTALLGWTFHSTVHRGFLGGAIGWSF